MGENMLCTEIVFDIQKNRADKNWVHFKKRKYFENQIFQKHFLVKNGHLIQYSYKKIFLGNI